MLRIHAIDAHVFRVPLDSPVSTSFGTMRDRPAVIISITDNCGVVGWGEIFCNWPAAGAEHRARLLLEDVAELVFESDWASPENLFYTLTDRTHIKALQTGEFGPFAQVIAGLDIAAWDLYGRISSTTVSRLLSSDAADHVPVYASGIQISQAETLVPFAREQGYDAFKLKVGFDAERDLELLKSTKVDLSAVERLMADANQAWSPEESIAFLKATEDLELDWLEEPMPVDTPDRAWSRVAAATSTPIAGGENLMGRDVFDRAIESHGLSVIQPDVAKWGGITECFAVGRAITEAGKCYCPHFLGAGVGLLASAHILAAVGGAGRLEIDVNPNPLRSEMFEGWPMINRGTVRMPPSGGLGLNPDLRKFEAYQTFYGRRERVN